MSQTVDKVLGISPRIFLYKVEGDRIMSASGFDALIAKLNIKLPESDRLLE